MRTARLTAQDNMQPFWSIKPTPTIKLGTNTVKYKNGTDFSCMNYKTPAFVQVTGD